MACNLIGLLSTDPKMEAIYTYPLIGQHWLAIKRNHAEYKTLELSSAGLFQGKIQTISEDDLLEGYEPDIPFYNQHLARPLKILAVHLSREQTVPSNLIPVLAGLSALVYNTAYSQNDLPEASKCTVICKILNDFLSAKPELSFIESLTNAAIIHRKNQNHDQAVYYYMKAMDIGGENPSILFNLARVYHEIGADRRAISSLKRALALNSDFKMARQFLNFLTTA